MEQSTDAVHLVVGVDLAVVEAILDLQADEVVLQIRAERGLQQRTVELVERAGLLLVLLKMEIEIREEPLNPWQQIRLLLQVVLL